MDENKTGGLILCATPIGNLGDISERLKQTLADCDCVAAEDTRHTRKLLNHLDIKKPMFSCHEHNESAAAEQLIHRMQKGETIAYASDAGMPLISDPGRILVEKAVAAGVPVTIVPGASAALCALALSGLDTRRFVFEGFLPAQKKQRQAILRDIANETRTLVLYEAPHRLRATLAELLGALGERPVALARELTKLHEQVLRTTLQGACGYFEQTQPRGEFTLVIAGAQPIEQAEPDDEAIARHVEKLLESGLSRSGAVARTAEELGVGKNKVKNIVYIVGADGNPPAS